MSVLIIENIVTRKEAIQLKQNQIFEVCEFCNGTTGNYPETGIGIDPKDGKFKIKTLEGVMVADMGDYIIKGLRGEFYPCKPDIFKKSYHIVDKKDGE